MPYGGSRVQGSTVQSKTVAKTAVFVIRGARKAVFVGRDRKKSAGVRFAAGLSKPDLFAGG
jgi:hypothetical protein